MRKKGFLALLLCGGLTWTGCGPALEPADLGHVVFTTPEVPVTDQSFELTKHVEPPPPDDGMPGFPPMTSDRQPRGRPGQ